MATSSSSIAVTTQTLTSVTTASLSTSTPSISTPSTPSTTTPIVPTTPVDTSTPATTPIPVVTTPTPTPAVPVVPDNSVGGDVVTVTQTSFSTYIPPDSTTAAASTTTPTSSSTTSAISSPTVSSAASTSSSGLSKSGTIAIAVVVPIAVIALLAILAFFFWRRNRDKKARLAARKGEIEDYGFDPNAPDGAGGPGPSSAAAIGGGLGAGALAGGAAAGAASSEMRQTYGDDDGTGYRGWGPTQSNNKRPSWLPEAAAGVGAAGVGAAAYGYGHQRDNSAGRYEQYPAQTGEGYPAQTGEDYYYPEENLDHHGGGPPDLPAKSYDRYDPAFAGGVAGAAAADDYREDGTRPLGVVNADVQRQTSNASSRYSTVSNDDNAGRSYQNSPAFPQHAEFPQPSTSGRPGRSTMGRGGADLDEGGRYDAVNF